LADYVQIPKETLGQNQRVTHYNDPVPRLPPATMGYAHYTPEIYISSENKKTVELKDILALDSSAAGKGNDQFTVLDVEAHRWYFNAISACYMTDKPVNGAAPANDLASNWAGTMIKLMGKNSGLTLVGGTSSNTAAVLAGAIASMSTESANALLSLIPGGFLVKPFIPSSTAVGGLTSAGTAALVAALGTLLGSNKM
jgi:hypothetical protein